MTSTVDIDSNLDFIFAELSLEGIDPDYTLSKKRVRHLIREVAEECIGEDMPEGNSFNIGQKMHNKVKAEQRTRLNKILGKEK